MKRSLIFFGLIFLFICFSFADPTDAQIQQYARDLGVPYEALKQLVDSYKVNITPVGVPLLDENELYEAYKSNAVRADSLYKGKQLRITGKINEIRTDYNGNPIIGIGGTSLEHLAVTFKKSEVIKISNLSKGQSITFIAICENFGSRVFMSDATLVQ